VVPQLSGGPSSTGRQFAGQGSERTNITTTNNNNNDNNNNRNNNHEAIEMTSGQKHEQHPLSNKKALPQQQQ